MNTWIKWLAVPVILLAWAPSALSAAADNANKAPGQEAWIPAQTFVMGDWSGTGRPDQSPPHSVTLSSFYIAPRLVTVEEYCEFLNEAGMAAVDGDFIVRTNGTEVLVNYPYSPLTREGDRYVPKPGTARQPMYYVTWEGAALYCNYLSAKEGFKPAYQPANKWACDFTIGGYHLPTEAQWECAARGGQSRVLYPWGNGISSTNANFGNALERIVDVGSYPANDYGLYDMAGNVMQWCNDWYKFEYYSECESGAVNPSGPSEAQLTGHAVRVLRGGAYYHPAAFQTCAYRYGTADTKGCFSFNGFRVARSRASAIADETGTEAGARRTEGSAAEISVASDWDAAAFVHAADKAEFWKELPFSFTLGGKASAEILKTWKVAVTNVTTQAGRRQKTLLLTEPGTDLEVACEITTYERFPVVDWILRVTNRGTNDTPILEDLRALDHSFSRGPDENREFILRHSRGSRAAASDFAPKDQLLGPKAHLSLGGHGGRPSDYCLPFMNLAWGSGGAIIAIGWSGQWLANFDRDEERSLRVRTGMENFRAKLHPGEAIRTPRMLLLFWNGEELLRGHNLFRQLMLEYGIPRVNGQRLVPPIAASFSGLNAYTEENQITVAPKYGERGIEVQWIDAGWFVGGWPNGAGTWEPKPENFPNGLGPVGDAVHAAGMKFLLWFEIERVSRGSQIAREHPDWVIGPITEYGGLFNWGIPEARQWMTDKVLEQLSNGKVDIFRMDFNMEPLMYWLRNDPPDRAGITEVRFVEGMYQIWDDLRARHPGLWIDNCASGGRMLDLETATRSISLTQSDAPYEPDKSSSVAVIGQLQNGGLNLYLPLHAGGSFGLEPSYEFRSAMTSGNVLMAAVESQPVSEVQPTVDIYHRVRPYFEGDYYPLFDHRADEAAWYGYQLHRPDQQRGMIVVFRRAQALVGSLPVSLHGINPGASYKLSDQDTKRSWSLKGSELRTLVVQIEQKPASRIIFYERE